MPYLTEDIQGIASGIIYGRKNQQIFVVEDKGNLLLVHDEHGNRFHVHPEKMTDRKPKEEVKVTEAEPKKGNKKTSQKSLF